MQAALKKKLGRAKIKLCLMNTSEAMNHRLQELSLLSKVDFAFDLHREALLWVLNRRVKKEEHIAIVGKALQQHELFSGMRDKLSDKLYCTLIKEVRLITVKQYEPLLSLGQKVDGFYLLVHGEAYQLVKKQKQQQILERVKSCANLSHSGMALTQQRNLHPSRSESNLNANNLPNQQDQSQKQNQYLSVNEKEQQGVGQLLSRKRSVIVDIKVFQSVLLKDSASGIKSKNPINYINANPAMEKVLKQKYPNLEVERVMHSGDHYGRLFLMKQGPSECCIVGKSTQAHFAFLPRVAYEKVSTLLHQEKIDKKIAFFNSFPMFQTITDSQLTQLFYLFKKRHFSLNQIIYKEGQEAKHLFIIKTGQVLLSRLIQIDPTDYTELRADKHRTHLNLKQQMKDDRSKMKRIPDVLLGPGRFFGEQEMLNKTARQQQAKSVSLQCELYSISLAKMQIGIALRNPLLMVVLEQQSKLKHKWDINRLESLQKVHSLKDEQKQQKALQLYFLEKDQAHNHQTTMTPQQLQQQQQTDELAKKKQLLPQITIAQIRKFNNKQKEDRGWQVNWQQKQIESAEAKMNVQDQDQDQCKLDVKKLLQHRLKFSKQFGGEHLIVRKRQRKQQSTTNYKISDDNCNFDEKMNKTVTGIEGQSLKCLDSKQKDLKSFYSMMHPKSLKFKVQVSKTIMPKQLREKYLNRSKPASAIFKRVLSNSLIQILPNGKTAANEANEVTKDQQLGIDKKQHSNAQMQFQQACRQLAKAKLSHLKAETQSVHSVQWSNLKFFIKHFQHNHSSKNTTTNDANTISEAAADRSHQPLNQSMHFLCSPLQNVQMQSQGKMHQKKKETKIHNPSYQKFFPNKMYSVPQQNKMHSSLFHSPLHAGSLDFG